MTSMNKHFLGPLKDSLKCINLKQSRILKHMENKPNINYSAEKKKL